MRKIELEISEGVRIGDRSDRSYLSDMMEYGSSRMYDQPPPRPPQCSPCPRPCSPNCGPTRCRKSDIEYKE
ncbi:MAG: hypothetical protein HYX24_03155 [Candidatus Aenigmarchaeota archaeon]|nr:hypothetical protein [Candidatus Aenigmarchaeota archaeon]